MQDLKADTAATVLIGPFVAIADGVTPVTDITLAGADHAELMKHDGTVFVDMTSNGRTFTHKEGGWYTLLLGTGDTDTEGRLTVVIMDTDECLPVWKDFMVLSKATYDSRYATKATGYMDVNVKAIGDTATPETSGKLHVLQGDGSAITAAGPTKTEMDNAHALLATPAEVNAEVVDALGTDTLAELSQGVPASTPTIKAALMLLYMIARNQLTTTASELSVYNDAATKIAKKALSDDETTYTEGKMASGV